MEGNIVPKLIAERNRWVKLLLDTLEKDTNFKELNPEKYNNIRKIIKGGSQNLLNICFTLLFDGKKEKENQRILNDAK